MPGVQKFYVHTWKVGCCCRVMDMEDNLFDII